jgi:hypothetical protein
MTQFAQEERVKERKRRVWMKEGDEITSIYF